VKLNLTTKLWLLSALGIITFFPLSGAILAPMFEDNAQQTITDKANVLLDTVTSARQYTSDNSKLFSQLNTGETFRPQTVPAFSAREIFEGLRSNPQYNDFLYKEATRNPTNLRDLADDFEIDLIDKFSSDEKLKEIVGIREINREQFLYISRPLSVSSPSCLVCHGQPQDAPSSMLARYGKENGFGWKLGEVVAAQTLLVPATSALKEASSLQGKVLGLFFLLFAVGVAIANFCLHHEIVKPIKQLTKVVSKTSLGELEEDFKHSSSDEIGVLSDAFNRLKTSLNIALDEFLRSSSEQRKS
jgi:methyl-accepting chemotaxis protein